MKLTTYGEVTKRKGKEGKPSIHINFDVGIFTMARAAMRLTKMTAGDQVMIGYSEPTNEWFIYKVEKGGFTLRPKKSEKSGFYGVLFNSAATAEQIAKSQKFKGKSAVIPLAPEPIYEQDPNEKDRYVDFWPILTASLQKIPEAL